MAEKGTTGRGTPKRGARGGRSRGRGRGSRVNQSPKAMPDIQVTEDTTTPPEDPQSTITESPVMEVVQDSAEDSAISLDEAKVIVTGEDGSVKDDASSHGEQHQNEDSEIEKQDDVIFESDDVGDMVQEECGECPPNDDSAHVESMDESNDILLEDSVKIGGTQNEFFEEMNDEMLEEEVQVEQDGDVEYEEVEVEETEEKTEKDEEKGKETSDVAENGDKKVVKRVIKKVVKRNVKESPERDAGYGPPPKPKTFSNTSMSVCISTVREDWGIRTLYFGPITVESLKEDVIQDALSKAHWSKLRFFRLVNKDKLGTIEVRYPTIALAREVEESLKDKEFSGRKLAIKNFKDMKHSIAPSPYFLSILDTIDMSAQDKSLIYTQLENVNFYSDNVWVYIENIPEDATELEVQGAIPNCTEVVMPRNKEDKIEGYAYVRLADPGSRREVFSEAKKNGLKVKDTALHVFRLHSNDSKRPAFSNQGGPPMKRARPAISTSGSYRAKHRSPVPRRMDASRRHFVSRDDIRDRQGGRNIGDIILDMQKTSVKRDIEPRMSMRSRDYSYENYRARDYISTGIDRSRDTYSRSTVPISSARDTYRGANENSRDRWYEPVTSQYRQKREPERFRSSNVYSGRRMSPGGYTSMRNTRGGWA